MVGVGSVLHDSYRIVRELGSGGMGVVFAAEHVRLPKQVAVKVLRRDPGGDAQAIGRFRREAELCSRLGHANIVEVLDFNVLEDGSPYLVMELLAGESLRERLRRTSTLPLPEALRLAREVADGLGAVHALGIVHRDLKPENIFLCRRGDRETVKILDFGISKILGSVSLHTRSDGVFGTPGYMSPEQARGEVQRIDARTDQFALAAILYEALAGRAAFMAEGDTPFSVLFKVVNAEPLPLFGVPDRVSAAIFRALAKEPEQRFGSVAELSAALGGTGTLPELAPAPAPVRNGKRARRMAAAAALGLVALGGGVTALLVGHVRPVPAPAPPLPAAAPVAQPPRSVGDRERQEVVVVDAGTAAASPAAPAAPVRPSAPSKPIRVKHNNAPRPPRPQPAQDDLVDPYKQDGR